MKSGTVTRVEVSVQQSKTVVQRQRETPSGEEYGDSRRANHDGGPSGIDEHGHGVDDGGGLTENPSEEGEG